MEWRKHDRHWLPCKAASTRIKGAYCQDVGPACYLGIGRDPRLVGIDILFDRRGELLVANSQLAEPGSLEHACLVSLPANAPGTFLAVHQKATRGIKIACGRPW